MIKDFLGAKSYAFALDVPGLSELETKHCGLWLLEARFAGLACSTAEVQDVFRLGLEGGGLTQPEALQLTGMHCVIGRLDRAREIGLRILSDTITSIEAVADEVLDTGKPEGEAKSPPRSASTKTGGSTGQPSMAGSPKKASRQRRSKASSPKT